ncbi:hypothetical protein D6D12_04199 [Aureobasidium pullulans]|uniref:BTB domain-containing protein n=1 Tax=Aureobasidium pullulans TaxID=5580 RepID=A0AB74JWL3_AURPU|nr:hypothetical protein D6D12_04199 [Aureobasidium pullulans]THX62421.1 hypothetical protein D6D11_02523 [Aureobasidium pullulans]
MADIIEGKNDWYATHPRHVLQEPNTYKFSDCALYNNSQDFDIILKFGEHKIYAHKVVLRMWSPFFSNAFKSRFTVATNPVFLLDDQEDDFEAVSAMVKHMYGMSYGKHSLNTGRFEPKDDWILDWEQVLNRQLAVYTAADKYDCPAVRRAARELMNICLGSTRFPAYNASPGMKTVNLTRLVLVFISLISKICGPDAPQLADQSLYTDTVNFCVEMHPNMIRHAEYRTAFQKKALYDAISQEKMYQAHITYLEGEQEINRP